MHAKNKTEFLKNDYWKASFSLCYCKVSFHFFFPHRPFFKNFSSLVHFFLFRNYSFLPFQTPICLRFSSFAGSSFPVLSNLRFRKTWETEISETWTCVPDVYPLSKLEKKLLSFKHVLLSRA